jgi:hypothetical protein
MSSLVNTLRRCHSTVRALMNRCAPISSHASPASHPDLVARLIRAAARVGARG